MANPEIWEPRPSEPSYGLLQDTENKEHNVYGQPIDLIKLLNLEDGEQQSLYINGNPAVGTNPNRNKQHGFYFTADNCIGCHACESACAEKNETPSHLAFRSVGYVEGGSYPDFQRMNLSMACNHCDDPVCLKGCPTNAYTKHTEYGAVLQDPDACFGCGYCTWVCPYNAPQLDPIKGEVSKCNMCVDRLEVGLKPSCVSACVGNALDFGVIENIPDNRQQAKTSIPGFPDPSITQPNIRFQQKNGLPEEMTRTDSAPIKYRLDKESNAYQPVLDEKNGRQKAWGLAKLNSHENPLVAFTLVTQAAIGAFVMSIVGVLLGLPGFQQFADSSVFIAIPIAGFALAALGLLISTTHLGKPLGFYRGFNNLRYSPVSREGFGVAVFMAFAALTAVLLLPAHAPANAMLERLMGFSLSGMAGPAVSGLATAASLVACIGALGGLYYMVKCYLIPARPFWNHWHTACSFLGNALSLGAIVAGAIAWLGGATEALATIAVLLAIGALLEIVGLVAHSRHNHAAAEHEGAASHYVQTTEFGHTYILRNVLLVCVPVIALLAGFGGGNAGPELFLVASILTMASALLGRALFYVLVIPTTMPGAFFWRNKGFAEHARKTGLADAVDAGLVS